MKTMSLWRVCALAALLAAAPATTTAGDFSVNPIRIFLDKDRKSDVVTVRNNGQQPLKFEIRPNAWRQGPSGEDIYSDTADLLVFPRLMTLAAGESRDIRIGVRIPPGTSEKTYRVFINELPPTRTAEEAATSSANVGFLINFAAPVFFAPLERKVALEVPSLNIAAGRISATVANTGNVHQLVREMTITAVDANGTEIYRSALSERYLLAGTSKSYAQPMPTSECKAAASLIYSVRTDKTSTNAKISLQKDSCSGTSSDAPAENNAR